MMPTMNIYQGFYIFISFISSNFFKLRKLSNYDIEDTPKVKINLYLF